MAPDVQRDPWRGWHGLGRLLDLSDFAVDDVTLRRWERDRIANFAAEHNAFPLALVHVLVGDDGVPFGDAVGSPSDFYVDGISVRNNKGHGALPFFGLTECQTIVIQYPERPYKVAGTDPSAHK